MMPGRRLLASWECATGLWLRWPGQLSGPPLERGRESCVGLCSLLDSPEPHPRSAGPVSIRVLAHGEEALRSARVALGATAATIYPTGQAGCWDGRESGLFGVSESGRILWMGSGGEAENGDFPRIASASDSRIVPVPFDFHRGAIETDGEGTALITRESWLRAERNTGLTADELEAAICTSFGIERVIWLDRGLPDGDAGGHVHRVARFLGPGRVLCSVPVDDGDPASGTQRTIIRSLERLRDARGRRFEVVPVPAAETRSESGASHLGFLRLASTIVVPTYPSTDPSRLHDAFAEIFPLHRIVLARAPVELGGGGSLHALVLAAPA